MGLLVGQSFSLLLQLLLLAPSVVAPRAVAACGAAPQAVAAAMG
jgi:hypothetical protein